MVFEVFTDPTFLQFLKYMFMYDFGVLIVGSIIVVISGAVYLANKYFPNE